MGEEAFLTVVTGSFQRGGERDAEVMDAMTNPDPSGFIAKMRLAHDACLEEYPMVKAALNNAARKRVDDREQTRADRWRAGLEASRGCK
eukprot:NODE_4422_length_319_cov_16.751852_g4340_i0.p1 GENE.NODE_4422_length_319_cov_16.751852_g4340_i0~~NODE_4422_length_319_cov_16.751852_g4340_i0.p1  ORF type:complete len:96 (+),score=31.33 NODE_4422_length_319_cov_16.751852_g4340_i0:23-289(+)